MQVSAWRAVVEKSTRLQSFRNSEPTTMDKIVSSTSTTMVVILVVLAYRGNVGCRSCNLILYATMAYAALLVPASFLRPKTSKYNK